MKKICIVTTCRADYGYLYWIMHDLEASSNELSIICPLNHHELSTILNESEYVYPTKPVASIKDYGQFYSDCLKIMTDTHFDVMVLLGDRFETLAAATAALLTGIKICHLYGGEATTGAFDDEIRNSITMMATYHFTATEQYAENVRRMTESQYVYNVGSTGLDWLHRAKLLSKDELQKFVSINLSEPFIIACLHPTTKELGWTKEHIISLINALKALETQVLWIGTNIDPNHEEIIQKVNEQLGWVNGWVGVDNLDHLTYLSLLQYAEMMIGNSSSGIIESASFDLPSVSVGNRQDGRIRGNNVFSCPCETEAILNAVDRAREWNAMVGKCDNPYGDGRSSERIVKILEGI